MARDPDQEAGQQTEAMPPREPDGLSTDPRSFQLVVIGGAAPERYVAPSNPCAIGSHPSNDLILDHPTVSRFHCQIEVGARGARIRDRDSLNGTVVDGVPISDAWLREGSVIELGGVMLQFGALEDRLTVPLSARDRFGELVGRSVAMRRLFAVLERCAASDATVLLRGETGVGKELCAEAIHDASERAGRPFVVVDCASLPPNLLEAELFGHERGAFTGATERRLGAFEAADGGTVFLDEIGELPPHLQPKMLRVLEQRTIRRIGQTEHRPIDVRIVAATHRPLHSEVNEGSFRADLYYRLAVVEVEIPPLRERLEDLPLLVQEILRRLGSDEATRQRMLSPAQLVTLQDHAWPGNVRQLRNHVERAIVLEGLETSLVAPSPPTGMTADASRPWTEARKLALAAFERAYIEALLADHGGNVTQAARAAQVDRVYLHRLMRRHGIRGDGEARGSL